MNVVMTMEGALNCVPMLAESFFVPVERVLFFIVMVLLVKVIATDIYILL